MFACKNANKKSICIGKIPMQAQSPRNTFNAKNDACGFHGSCGSFGLYKLPRKMTLHFSLSIKPSLSNLHWYISISGTMMSSGSGSGSAILHALCWIKMPETSLTKDFTHAFATAFGSRGVSMILRNTGKKGVGSPQGKPSSRLL